MGVLIAGSSGQLGRALQTCFPEAQLVDLYNLDVSDWQAVQAFDWHGINLIINAAAYTAVDLAEKPEELRNVWSANVTAVANLAQIATNIDATLVHVSTDYVFDGSTKQPYAEDEPMKPLNVYGRSKAAGDMAAISTPRHFVFRTSWVIGDGKNFVRTMLTLSKEKDTLQIIDDQIGRPTFTDDLAKAISAIVSQKDAFGLYNCTNAGDPVSWAGLAEEIFRQSNTKCKVEKISTEEYGKNKAGIAKRPLYSTLNLGKLAKAGVTMPDWKTSLSWYLEQERPAE